jgi:hypothetical protein
MTLKLLIATMAVPLLAVPLQSAFAQGLFASPKPGQGQVIFFRPKSVSFSEKCHIRERGAMIGRVGNGRYFILSASPGAHQYATKVISEAAVSVTVEQGKTSFVKCKIGEGISIGRPLLYLSDRASFDEKLSSMAIEDPKKMAREIAIDVAKRATYGGE